MMGRVFRLAGLSSIVGFGLMASSAYAHTSLFGGIEIGNGMGFFETPFDTGMSLDVLQDIQPATRSTSYEVLAPATDKVYPRTRLSIQAYWVHSSVEEGIKYLLKSCGKTCSLFRIGDVHGVYREVAVRKDRSRFDLWTLTASHNWTAKKIAVTLEGNKSKSNAYGTFTKVILDQIASEDELEIKAE